MLGEAPLRIARGGTVGKPARDVLGNGSYLWQTLGCDHSPVTFPFCVIFGTNKVLYESTDPGAPPGEMREKSRTVFQAHNRGDGSDVSYMNDTKVTQPIAAARDLGLCSTRLH